VVTEGFVLRIPDALALDVAAPLLCAGITTYSPLRHWNAGDGTRVGVIGLGGFGHMAVRFAKALGSEVTVLTRMLDKEADARRLGADHVFATSDRSTFTTLGSSLDLVINTVSASIDMGRHLRMLDVDGVFVNVGMPVEPLSIKVLSLLNNRRSIAGSPIGGIRETQEMLDVAAENGFGSDVEKIGADQIDAAYERVVAGDVRYRFVIDIESML
jgi:uncharacterized zinc-type alcohol dehydrogenase-like protein